MNQRTIPAILLLCLLLLTGLPGCGSDPEVRSDDEEEYYDDEMMAMVDATFAQSDHVLDIRVYRSSVVDTLNDDQGKPGYQVIEVRGTVITVYKGDFKAGDPVAYRFEAEYDPEWKMKWGWGTRWLVFVHDGSEQEDTMTCPEQPCQMPLTRQLREHLEELAKK